MIKIIRKKTDAYPIIVFNKRVFGLQGVKFFTSFAPSGVVVLIPFCVGVTIISVLLLLLFSGCLMLMLYPGWSL